ncbi:VOC family protein [Chryseobacterium aquaticum]|uniref:VOC family protein n=1 Tax=Chryseobacterium aquaticum TaxID=452084 RepID=A0A848MXD1_9FLAO|nr:MULTISPECIES: VOC family protein [Chryseobacterium]NMR33227.1 VOC family protein [Chryseobacterium aquaticum]NRQ44841.1 VOC family protein [Chryseobacterium sp. C-204]
MMTVIIPKLPMRNKETTRKYYTLLGFNASQNDFEGYLMMVKDTLEIHFFEFRELLPSENYGQIYIRCSNIDAICKTFLENNIEIHPAGHLKKQHWGQKEFSLLDPDNNLITFGQALL